MSSGRGHLADAANSAPPHLFLATEKVELKELSKPQMCHREGHLPTTQSQRQIPAGPAEEVYQSLWQIEPDPTDKVRPYSVRYY